MFMMCGYKYSYLGLALFAFCTELMHNQEQQFNLVKGMCEMYSSMVMSEPDRDVKGFCSGTAPINVPRDHVSICNLPPLYVGVSQKY